MKRATSLLCIVLTVSTWIFSYSVYVLLETIFWRPWTITELRMFGLNPYYYGWVFGPAFVAFIVGCFANGLEHQRLPLKMVLRVFVFGVALGTVVILMEAHYPHSDRIFVFVAATCVPIAQLLSGLFVRREMPSL